MRFAHRFGATFRLAVALVLGAISALGAVATVQAAIGEESAPGTSGRVDRRGFYLGFHVVRDYVRMSLDNRAILPQKGVTMDEWGAGPAFTFGYQPSRRFHGEAELSVTSHAAHPDDAETGTAVFRLTGYVPILTSGPFEPHLIGGFSAWSAFFIKKGSKGLLYGGVSGDAGIGLRVHLGRHWSMQADYFHSAVDIDQEITDRGGDQTDMQPVGHRGRAEVMRFGWIYDF